MRMTPNCVIYNQNSKLDTLEGLHMISTEMCHLRTVTTFFVCLSNFQCPVRGSTNATSEIKQHKCPCAYTICLSINAEFICTFDTCAHFNLWNLKTFIIFENFIQLLFVQELSFQYLLYCQIQQLRRCELMKRIQCENVIHLRVNIRRHYRPDTYPIKRCIDVFSF